VTFGTRKARVQSVSDDSITVLVPRLRTSGPQPVTLMRDRVSADNVLAFDYVLPQ
jgi:hypothetical protein